MVWQPKIESKEDAISFLNTLKEDFTMLRDGTWSPDEDSIDASITIVDALLKYVSK